MTDRTRQLQFSLCVPELGDLMIECTALVHLSEPRYSSPNDPNNGSEILELECMRMSETDHPCPVGEPIDTTKVSVLRRIHGARSGEPYWQVLAELVEERVWEEAYA